MVHILSLNRLQPFRLKSDILSSPGNVINAKTSKVNFCGGCDISTNWYSKRCKNIFISCIPSPVLAGGVLIENLTPSFKNEVRSFTLFCWHRNLCLIFEKYAVKWKCNCWSNGCLHYRSKCHSAYII